MRTIKVRGGNSGPVLTGTPGNAVVIAPDGQSVTSTPIGPGAGVTSWDTRTGAVTPQNNDYEASQIFNDSSVGGLDVRGALNTLLAAIAAVTGLPAVTAADNGDNLSVVGGLWAKAANAFRSVTTIADRNALTASGIVTAGMLAYVSTTQCLYMLGNDLATWSFFAPSPALAKQAAWAVDVAAGSDNNSGLPGSPLKTVEEFSQRLSPGGAKVTLQQATTCTLAAGSYGQLNLNLDWFPGAVAFGNGEFAVIGTMVSSAPMVLTAVTPENPATQVSNELVTAAGAFVNRQRIRVTNGVRIGSLTYSTGLNGSALDTFVGTWLNYVTNSNAPPAVGDSVVTETWATTLAYCTIAVRGTGNVSVRDMTLTQLCALDDYTTVGGHTTGGGGFIFGCDLSSTFLVSNTGAYVWSCRIPVGAATSIKSGQWKVDGTAVQGKLYVYTAASCSFDDSGNFIDGGNFIVGGTSTSNHVGNSTCRIAGNVQFCNGTATSAVSVSQGATLQNGAAFLWSRAGATPYLVAFEADVCSSIVTSTVWTGANCSIAATNGFQVAGQLYAFADAPISAPQYGAYVLSFLGGIANGSARLTAQAANLGATALVPAAPPGDWIVEGYLDVNTAGTAGALTLNAIFTDDSGVARTVPVCSIASIAGVNGLGGVISVQTRNGSAIQYSVTGIVTPGALQYSLRVTARKNNNGA